LQGIEEHPVVVKYHEELVQSFQEQGVGKPPLLTEFTHIGTTPLWIEVEEGICPALGLSLHGTNRKILFEATLDLDDLSFLTAGCTELLRAELQRAKHMVERQTVRIPYSFAIAQRIEQIRLNVEAMSALKEVIGSAPEKPAH
jgi:hypothetical protein